MAINPATLAVTRGQEYFRLTERILSVGAIFTIDQSLKAVVIGPQSELSELVLNYYDPQEPGSQNQVIVTPGTPFIGRIDALGATTFPVSGNPAVITAFPNQATTVAVPVPNIVPPLLDVLFYFSDPSNVTLRRANFFSRQRFNYLDTVPGDFENVALLPYFGRQKGSVQFNNQTAGESYEFGVEQVRIGSPPSGAGTNTMSRDIAVSATVAPGGNAVIAWDAATEGFFDFVLIKVKGSGADTSNLLSFWAEFADA